jgi:hypothetical protein
MKTFTLMTKKMVEDEGGSSGMKSPVHLMWGGTGLDKENVPAWNVSYKGNVTFDENFAENFHSVDSQLW